MSEAHKAPIFLDKTGRAEWKRIVKILEDRGLFDELRLSSVEAYCSAYSHWRETEVKLAAATDPGEIDRLSAHSNTCQRHMRDHGRDLGLPCNVQVRNKPPVSTPEDESPDDEIAVRDPNEYFFRVRRSAQ